LFLSNAQALRKRAREKPNDGAIGENCAGDLNEAIDMPKSVQAPPAKKTAGALYSRLAALHRSVSCKSAPPHF
jgi:hypothetical protein